jgi:hypothetical protein
LEIFAPKNCRIRDRAVEVVGLMAHVFLSVGQSGADPVTRDAELRYRVKLVGEPLQPLARQPLRPSKQLFSMAEQSGQVELDEGVLPV